MTEEEREKAIAAYKKKMKANPSEKVQGNSQAIDALNLQRIEYYVALGNLVYNDFLEDLANIAAKIPGGISKIKVFNFDDYPSVKARITSLINSTNIKIVNIIKSGVDDAFLRAHAKNDLLVDAVFNATGIPKKKLARYYNHNLSAAVTKMSRSKLSERVYKNTQRFKQIAEASLDQGLAAGKTARQLARDIKLAVKEPEFTFRRVRNAKGNLQWSKAAKAYAKDNPPGQGVYLNPRKNYERLTRTTINMSYRAADHERNESMDFIVGIRINLSTNPNHCPFCIQMAGLYPKNFLFRGWHPQCRCYRTTVLKSRAELDKDIERILAGQEPKPTSRNTVKAPPVNFNAWISENADKLGAMAKAGTLPYWYLDNFKDGVRVAGSIVGGL